MISTMTAMSAAFRIASPHLPSEQSYPISSHSRDFRASRASRRTPHSHMWKDPRTRANVKDRTTEAALQIDRIGKAAAFLIVLCDQIDLLPTEPKGIAIIGMDATVVRGISVLIAIRPRNPSEKAAPTPRPDRDFHPS